MAPKATVVKAELQVSDMDRHYYATHMLTLAQHPSETDERLMVRLLAFALYAQDRLEFGRGLSNEEEPDLWRRDYVGDIELWIDLGQPDETRIKKACGRAQQVVVINYSGRGADIWWDKIASSLTRLKNLTVIDVSPEVGESLTTLIQRGMRLNCLIQDGEMQLMSETINITLTPAVRMAVKPAS
ncbi:MAG: YaeQ family protein [Pseudomonadota bacterium]|nr:YaeQ family protein [Pseudomonadota bacterium]